MSSSTTNKDWLNSAVAKLKAASISTARLDCLVLLEDESGKERGWLLAHPEYELQIEQTKSLNNKVAQRSSHIPLAYIRGKTEFYGRDFYVDKRVLEPRPESETMIDMLKKLYLQSPSIIDVGTGSGALAITAKLEIQKAKVTAIDIDQNCLDIAKINSSKYATDIFFLKSNLLAELLTFDYQSSILLCNLPYVPDSFHINPAAMNEPRKAIFGGFDGLELYRNLFEQLKGLKSKPRYILAESMPPQHTELAKIAASSGYALNTTDDFIQLFEF